MHVIEPHPSGRIWTCLGLEHTHLVITRKGHVPSTYGGKGGDWLSGPPPSKGPGWGPGTRQLALGAIMRTYGRDDEGGLHFRAALR